MFTTEQKLCIYIVLLVIFFYFFEKEVKAGLLRFFNIKSPLVSKEYYTVTQKINYQPDADFIVACSLFGNLEDPKIYNRYFLPLLKDGPEMMKLYPGSVIRIYTEPNLPKRYLDEMLVKNFEVHIMSHPSRGFSGSFWRALAFEDKKKESIVFMSDTDPVFHKHFTNKSLNIPQILQDWYKSDKKFLIIGSHLIYVPCSINRIGMRNHIIPGMVEKINQYEGRIYGEDEVFMKKEIWPLIQKEGFYRHEITKEKFVMAFVCVLILLIVGVPIYIFYELKKKHK